MECHESEKHPCLSGFWGNLRKEIPWLEKFKLFLRNNWIKIRNLQSCCGHPGEPGC